MTKKSQNSFSLAIHGGAGGKLSTAKKAEPAIRKALSEILEEGRAILAKGGTALDAVNHCVRLLEDCPLFNSAYGAEPNRAGKYELDAAIMDGKTLQAGAVAAVLNVRNPVDLARLVMTRTPHVMLSGKGAIDFARAQKIPMVTQSYYKSAAKAAAGLIDNARKHGTVGAVARDIHGNLAAATSTGGTESKMPGRIGDSPIIGAGNFADNDSAAISCTGIGEHFIRTTVASHAAFLVERENMTARDAAQETLDRLVRKVKGDGAFIMVDKKGNVAVAQNSTLMRCGWIEKGGATQVTLQAPIRPRVKKTRRSSKK